MHMLPLAELFVNENVSRHGQPVSITSDRDSRFVLRFWKMLHESMGTKLQFSTAYHPQTNGQLERTIHTLEDMLRACVLDFKTQWDKTLPLCEFVYNNSYHSSIGMAPFEALCHAPEPESLQRSDLGDANWEVSNKYIFPRDPRV
ncbi:hypothetical protein MRB53_002060 [Persea americana]|uniref:Uncharacterized protein n=1 Tax=Persea americana TaxID=3435 RepID=A0ACC2MVT6_PERAE|nr:hypothetical protein MRB53_002060 [Persea americana]